MSEVSEGGLESHGLDIRHLDWIAAGLLPKAIELFVGSGPDVYHALELANALTSRLP